MRGAGKGYLEVQGVGGVEAVEVALAGGLLSRCGSITTAELRVVGQLELLTWQRRLVPWLVPASGSVET